LTKIIGGIDMKRGLLLVDIQNDYFPGGKMELVGMDEAAMRAKELLERCHVFPSRHRGGQYP
jgi:nicotinamidase-related amidase